MQVHEKISEKRRVGRPRVSDYRVIVGVSHDLIMRVDNWRRAQSSIPTRPEAIRALVEAALVAKGV